MFKAITKPKARIYRLETVVIAISVLLTGCATLNSNNIEPNSASTPYEQRWHWDNPQKQNANAGYTQAVRKGSHIYISGVPTNDQSCEGIKRVYKAIQESLRSVGGEMNDIVKETLYTTNIEEMKRMNNCRKEIYGNKFPAATWLQVSRFYQSDAVLEVDVVAILPQTK